MGPPFIRRLDDVSSRTFCLLLAFTLATVGLTTISANASDGCPQGAVLNVNPVTGERYCYFPSDNFPGGEGGGKGGPPYELEPRCETTDTDGDCWRPVWCNEPQRIRMYRVLLRGRFLGYTCLRTEPPEITPGMALREMKRLAWPGASLQVQPTNGKTLVNFETNFYTESTKSHAQTIELLGQSLTIQLTPSSYTWHFDDDSSMSTSSPGAPYPNLDITHAYEQPGEVSPSVDVTYSGRFRVEDGEWQDIPETLTVPGEAVALQILEGGGNLTGQY